MLTKNLKKPETGAWFAF